MTGSASGPQLGQAGPDGEDWLVEAVRVLRRLGPDVLDQIAVLATALADVLREPDPGSEPPPGTPAAGSPGAVPVDPPPLVPIEISG